MNRKKTFTVVAAILVLPLLSALAANDFIWTAGQFDGSDSDLKPIDSCGSIVNVQISPEGHATGFPGAHSPPDDDRHQKNCNVVRVSFSADAGDYMLRVGQLVTHQPEIVTVSLDGSPVGTYTTKNTDVVHELPFSTPHSGTHTLTFEQLEQKHQNGYRFDAVELVLNGTGEADKAERQLDQAGEPSTQSSVGIVKVVIGEVWHSVKQGDVETQRRRLNIGDSVTLNSVLETGKKGRAYIKFIGGTVSIGRQSKFNVRKYDEKVWPVRGELRRTPVIFDVIYGYLREVAIAGLLGKRSIPFASRNSTCGARGTDYALGYDESLDADLVMVREGEVEVFGLKEGRVIVSAGKQVWVREGKPGRVEELDMNIWLRNVPD